MTLFLHEFKLGNNAAQTTANINKAWEESTTSGKTVQRRFQKFRDGDESLKDEDGRGRPPILQNEDLRAIVEQNPRQSVREMSMQLGVGILTVFDHLKQIRKVKKLEKWVPHEVNELQRARRFELCSMLFLRNNRVPFLVCSIICDEKWILYDNRKQSRQWLDRDESPKHFSRPKLHPQKIMVTVW